MYVYLVIKKIRNKIVKPDFLLKKLGGVLLRAYDTKKVVQNKKEKNFLEKGHYKLFLHMHIIYLRVKCVCFQ